MPAGIYGDIVIGPLFIDSSLNEEIHVSLLENTLEPSIVEHLEYLVDLDGNRFVNEG